MLISIEFDLDVLLCAPNKIHSVFVFYLVFRKPISLHTVYNCIIDIDNNFSSFINKLNNNYNNF